mgnify:CR=1 FL=1
MKVGDLVKYDSTDDLYQWDGEIGIIVDFKHMFSSGGGGAWPSSETFAIVSWSCEARGTWITNEREENLEVINGDR